MHTDRLAGGYKKYLGKCCKGSIKSKQNDIMYFVSVVMAKRANEFGFERSTSRFLSGNSFRLFGGFYPDSPSMGKMKILPVSIRVAERRLRGFSGGPMAISACATEFQKKNRDKHQEKVKLLNLCVQ